MILRGVRVESWRCLRDPIELGPLGPGLNIVFGPNESGKSTLVDAICLGFHDRHNVKGSQILSRRPWGAVLGPTVEIEFELGDEAYQLRKRFLESPRSELQRWHAAEQRWEKVARGRTADDQLLALVQGSVAGRGLSKPEHWGIGQVLWARQGESSQLTVGTSQQAQLREALRISLNTARGETIEGAIAQRYDQLFTSRGKLRSRSEAALLGEKLEQTVAEAERIAEQLDVVTATAAELDEAEQQRADLEAELSGCGERLERCNQQLESLSGAQHRFERLEATCAQLRERWLRLQQQRARIQHVDAAVESARGHRLDAARAVETAEENLASALAERDSRRAAAREGQVKLGEADRALRWLTCNCDLQRAEREQERIGQLGEAIAGADRELSVLAAPTSTELQQLQRLDQRRRSTQAELDSSSLTVQITPDQGASMVAATAIDGGVPRDERIESTLTLRAASSLRLDIEGVGRISVQGGTSDATELVAELSQIERQWQAALAPFGDQTLQNLAEQSARRQLVEQRLADLRRQAEGVASAAVLSQRVSELQSRRTALLERGESLSFCWDSFERAVAQTEQDRDTLDAAAIAGAEALEVAAEELDESRHQLSEVKQELARAAATLQERQAEARRQRAEDGLTDEQRKQQLREAQQAMERSEAELGASSRPPVADLRAERRSQEQQVVTLQQRLQEQQRRIGSLERDLQQAGGEGLYSRLAVASERREELQRRLARARLDTAGVQLLWQTVQQCKQGLFEALLGPVRQRVVEGMRELIGPRYEDIEFGGALTPERVQPVDRQEKAAIEDLSFGTQGQLMLLVRLALAGLMQQGGQDRQCVIVEDPLISSDPQRQQAAMQLLARAAEETQIIVLTCQPAAYQAIDSARFFDMSDL